jgi:hypothetical protein
MAIRPLPCRLESWVGRIYWMTGDDRAVFAGAECEPTEMSRTNSVRCLDARRSTSGAECGEALAGKTNVPHGHFVKEELWERH